VQPEPGLVLARVPVLVQVPEPGSAPEPGQGQELARVLVQVLGPEQHRRKTKHLPLPLSLLR
jgi:hypothetical protein